MKEKELSEIREKVAASVKREITGWDIKLAKLEGIAEGLMGRGKWIKPANVVMAKKLCCYYMRKSGFSYPQIGAFMKYKTHVTAMHHYNNCVSIIEDKQFSDKDYLKAHRLAKENGVW